MTTENPAHHALIIVDTQGLLTAVERLPSDPASPAELDPRHFCILHSRPATGETLLLDTPELVVAAGDTLLLHTVPVALLGEEMLFSHSPVSEPLLDIELAEQRNLRLALPDAAAPLQPTSRQVDTYHWRIHCDQPGEFKLAWQVMVLAQGCEPLAHFTLRLALRTNGHSQ
ncbi:hypothetical protein PUR31_17900 [Pseudomonas mosselii]|uniref:hypothetical protein n=1 Tax=unclassified Pseudomonas TaxID=196821 RepID=UPI0020C4B724|nr:MULTISPECIES: hypothetical protein [unclassified Pseudomonas]MCP8633130.1 hypothetical protein [Pseudomonas sp. DVZ6]MDC0690102.1 hypothetical protein [Mitsuaria sp. RG]MDD7785973.1 hypothetical protein [Pseudomonas sp. DVZ24]